MRSILVTGATGYLGSKLTSHLVNEKQDVSVLVRNIDTFSNPNRLPAEKVLDLSFLGANSKKFDCIINCATRYKSEESLDLIHSNIVFPIHDVEVLDLESVLSNSDIITLHVPGNSDGSPMLGKNEISKIKSGAFLINVARGGVVDESALLEALKYDHLAGAAIDVFSEEPYSGPFCDLDNVVLTPHLGSYAKEGKLQMEIDAVQNLIDVLKK